MRSIVFGILSFLLPCFVTDVCAQDEVDYDSLIRVMYGMPVDTNRLVAVHELAYTYSDVDSVIKFAEMEVELSRRFGKPYYEMRAYGYLYWAYFNLSDYVKANENASKAIVLAERMGDRRVLAKNYQNIGSTYSALQDYVKSDNYYHKALDIFTQVHDTVHVCDVLRDIGFNDIRNEMFDEAEKCFVRTLELDSIRDDVYSISEDYLCLGALDMARYEGGEPSNREVERLRLAKEYYLRAYELAQELNYEYTLVSVYGEFPHVLLCELECVPAGGRRAELLDSCRVFIRRGIEYVEENNYDARRFDFDMAWARYLAMAHQPLKAKEYLDSVAAANADVEDCALLHKINTAYTVICEELGDFRGAYRHLQSAQYYYKKNRRTDYTISATQNMVQADYEDRISEARERQRMSELDAERSSVYTKLAMVILVAFVLVMITIFYFMLKMRRTNMALKSVNREITDSINYAALIQRAVMPSPAFMSSLFSDYVVFHRPLNIVSGDFYWVSQVGRYKMVAVADCTGHGVPGAFLSMLGMSVLDYLAAELSHRSQAVNGRFAEAANSDVTSSEILASIVDGRISFNHVSVSESRAAEISAGRLLSEMREMFLKSMHFDGSTEINDSIDLALVVFDLEARKMHYAGAKRPLLIVRGGEIRKIKPDRMPIGRADFQTGQFVDHQLDMMDGDVVYLYSDGFVDQFGYDGERECKYTARRFERLIGEVSKFPLGEQKARFEEALEAWRTSPVGGNMTEQTDDITVVGVKIGFGR